MQTDPRSPGYHLADVEDGFARVATESGRIVGHVSRDKRGSQRTSTQWQATHRVYGNLGWSFTRTEAVALVTAKQDELAEKLAKRRTV